MNDDACQTRCAWINDVWVCINVDVFFENNFMHKSIARNFFLLWPRYTNAGDFVMVVHNYDRGTHYIDALHWIMVQLVITHFTWIGFCTKWSNSMAKSDQLEMDLIFSLERRSQRITSTYITLIHRKTFNIFTTSTGNRSKEG